MTSLFPNSNIINIDKESQLNYEASVLTSHAIILDVLKKVDVSQKIFIKGLWRDKELYKEEIPFNIIFKKSQKSTRNSIKLSIKEIDNEHFILTDNINIKKNSYRYGKKIEKEAYQLTVEKKELQNSLFGKEYIILEEKNNDILISTLLNNLSIKREFNRLLSISYEDSIPRRAKNIVTQLILSYKAYNLKNRQLQDVTNIDFFDKTIVEIENRLNKIQNRLGNYQLKHEELLLLGSEDRFFFNIMEKKRSIENLALKLNALKKTKERIVKGVYSVSLLENNDLKVNDLGNLIEELREKSNKSTLFYQQNNDRYSPLIKDLSYTKRLTKLSIAKKKLEELSIEYTSEYLEVKKTKKSIDILEKELKLYLQNHMENYSSEVKELKKKIQTIITSLMVSIQKKYNSLQASLKKDKRTINRLPKSSMKFEELKREFQLNKNNHKKLLQKRGESVISKASTISNIQIINSATLAQTPLKPKESFIYFSGFILGIFLSILYVSIKINRDKTIHNQEDVKLENYSLFFNNKNIYEDNLLTLIAKFEQLKGSKKSNIVLVSSNDYSENKTSTVVKLAWALTNISQKVLVIDFDVYHAKLTNSFNKTQNIGLSTLLKSRHSFDEMDIKEYLTHLKKENRSVDLLATGPILPNGSELLFHSKNKFLLENLSEKYDYILIDTPPIGKYPETTILFKYIDVFLVTAVIQKTYKDFFDKLKAINQNNLEKIIFLYPSKK
jgi:uncharacterized protein involved in exopolysaccharide biosynthesis